VEWTFKNYNSVPYHLSAKGANSNMLMTIQFPDKKKNYSKENNDILYLLKCKMRIALRAMLHLSETDQVVPNQSLYHQII
jgi:hypothetical protein